MEKRHEATFTLALSAKQISNAMRRPHMQPSPAIDSAIRAESTSSQAPRPQRSKTMNLKDQEQ